MEVKNIYKRHAFRVFITLLLLIGGLSLLNSAIGLNANEIQIVFISIVGTLLLRIVDMNKKQPVIYLFLLSVIGVVLILSTLTKHSMVKEYKMYWEWLVNGRFNEEQNNLNYQIATLLILGIIIGTSIYVLLQNSFIRVIATIPIILGLILLCILQNDVPKLLVICCLTYVLIMITEYSYRLLYKNRGPDVIDAMTYLLPVFMLISILLFALPTKQQPMEWRFVKNLWKSISDSTSEVIANIKVWVHPENADYTIKFAGYSEEGSVGGSIISSENEVLRVDLNKKIKGGFYLQGNIKNYYTKNEWSDTDRKFKNFYQLTESQLDLLEFYYALAQSDLLKEEDNMPSFADTRVLTIEFANIFTKSIFLPSKMVEVDIKNNAGYEKYGNLRFKKLKGKDTKYTVESLELNLGNESLIELLKYARRFNQKTVDINGHESDFIAKLLKRFEISNSFNLGEVLNTLSKYNSYVRENYSNLPDHLPMRVVRLSEELTKAYSTDYEKCKAIEQYLQTYKYTLSPKKIREANDVVDELLFETKEGYCTHFATTFAIMARTIGIPTRYVQGFYVEEETIDKKNVYTVKDDNAHAWAEAYIEGIGWIPFEPTPSYQEYRYTTWAIEVNGNNVKPTPSNNNILTGEMYQEIEELGEDNLLTPKKEGFNFGKIILICIIFTSIICSVLFVVLKFNYNNRQYNKLGKNKRILIDMMQIMYLLEKMGYERLKEETIHEYFSRIQCGLMDQEKLPSVLNTFIRVRYHEEELEEALDDVVLDFKKELLQKFRMNLGYIRYKIISLKMLIANPYIEFHK